MVDTETRQGGRRLVESLTAPDWAPGETALITDLDAALTAGAGAELDLGGLVASWSGHRSLRFGCPVVGRSVAWLADVGAPPEDGSDGPGLGAAVVTLALAPALHRSPRNLVAGTFHLARLLDPHPEGVFAAVSAAVTAAALLDGRRDFVPDVLDVLLANDGPPSLLTAIRLVPVWDPPSEGAEGGTALAAELAGVLRVLHHVSVPARAEAALAPFGADARRLGLALLAARGATS